MPPDTRPAAPQDERALEALYAAAFPDEPLWPLVRALTAPQHAVISEVACSGDGAIIGHVMVTPCRAMLDRGTDRPVALLGPLAVRPDRQGRGIGSRLVAAACDRAAARGCTHVLVLGDPGYYARFGFTAEAGLRPPYPLPTAWLPAWQSLGLGGGPDAIGPGTLRVPGPWNDPALWAP